MCTQQPTTAELELHCCLERADEISGDPETTTFKRQARLHQALWREQRDLDIGSQPMRPRAGEPFRPIGSNIELASAHATGVNFLTDEAWEAARRRVSRREPHEMLNVDRLYANLLSSMTMCFNLFGPLERSPQIAAAAVKSWWPDVPGQVREVRFEWSPGRRIEGRFLENRSAFDVAFELELNDGSFGIIGVETKYHEHCKRDRVSAERRLRRYRQIADKSGVFSPGGLETVIGTRLQQIWLDHLLALSMLQDHSKQWSWVRFVLVYPARNPSYARAAADYSRILDAPSTFEARTIESLVVSPPLSADSVALFCERYLW